MHTIITTYTSAQETDDNSELTADADAESDLSVGLHELRLCGVVDRACWQILRED